MASVYGNKPETKLYETSKTRRNEVVNHVLLGTRLDVLDETSKAYRVDSRGLGRSGWVKKSDVRNTPVLKMFFVDVGQGDGAIIESPEGIILLDGGPTSKYYHFLLHRYKRILQEEGKVNIKAIIMSHPDWDHFNGLTPVLNDKRFHIGNIYHNGIIRYDKRPPGRNSEIGTVEERVINGKTKKILTETFSTLDDAQALINEGFLMTTFSGFWEAAITAKSEGRLNGAKCITVHDKMLPGYTDTDNTELKIDVLGPITVGGPTDDLEYLGFPDAEDIAKENPSLSESHTINGHSLILKFRYGKHSMLLGGDLNIPSELNLLEYYGDENPFRVDVAKSCHHGSSDYLVDYLKQVKPQVNVVSSGDNKSYDHPMSDAVGASCRHTRGSHPLFFSTEIARAVSGRTVHYGLINLRSNGKVLAMAQMKEQHNRKDVWDSYTVPWRGKFNHEIREYRKNKEHD